MHRAARPLGPTFSPSTGPRPSSAWGRADSLPRGADRKAFIFSTCGMPVFAAGKSSVTAYAVKNHSALREKLTSRGYEVIGEFSCAGHNTNSYLKLFGGLNKGRPNADDLADAEESARALKRNLESGNPR